MSVHTWVLCLAAWSVHPAAIAAPLEFARGGLGYADGAQGAAPAAQPQTPTAEEQKKKAAQQKQEEEKKKAEQEQPAFEDLIVVTASKVEQQLVNAPATVSVISTDAIVSTPSTNYAELLRAVPGVNISQTSARDFNITTRAATSTLSTSQLALLDGRSLYLDFFGFVAWDMVPVNPTEIRQIEVIRGPASAVWGANALSGVVNFISRSPREMAGDNLSISFGAFDRSVPGDEDAGTGSMLSLYGTHARAANDRWAYKVSAGYYGSDAFARPIGEIPNGTGTQYPPYQNQGTSQPKFDARVDYDSLNGRDRWTFAGGYAATEGIIHTGIGPFDMQGGTALSYGTVRYARNAFKVNFFTNILNGDATGLLAIGLDGQPLPFVFDTKTFDWEVGNVNTIGARHVLSYGGNVRYNQFDLSIAPLGDNRSEGGAYVQDEIFLNDHFRFNLGARIDKFSVIDNPVFSPRLAFIYKPHVDHAIRLSYNRAFRAPSLINNFLEVTIVNQIDLGLLVPALAGTLYSFPIQAIGNQDLTEEAVTAVELGYTGVVNERLTLSAAVYWSTTKDGIYFTQTDRYRATNPPPGWPLPPLVLEVIPGGLPSQFSYLNLGEIVNKGVELGVDAAVNRALNVFVNYSYQATPDPDFALDEVNLPPKNRFNAGFNYSEGRLLGNASISYVDDAFWQDVLTRPYHGPTDAYTQLNGAFGVRWADGRIISTIKVINLFNDEIQNHVFGDVLKRQVMGELRFQF